MNREGFGEPQGGAPMKRASDERGQLGDRADRPPDPAAPPAEDETPPYHKEDEQQPGLLAVVRETVVLVALAVLLAVVFKTFLVAAFYIPSGSMESTLNISDRVLVEKVSYRLGDVERGDVVVFVHDEPGFEPAAPSNPVTGFFSSLGQAIGVVPPSDRDFIKRVVGVPGDRITCDGQLVRNGQKVTEPYLDPGTTTDGCKQTVVGPGELFVMGDNRTNSQDSRTFGVIRRSDVVGRAFVRIWPLNHAGWLRRDR
jgi:signal peptidase I